MRCPACGTECFEGAVICEKCGAFPDRAEFLAWCGRRPVGKPAEGVDRPNHPGAGRAATRRYRVPASPANPRRPTCGAWSIGAI